jgi:hypothetical protein
LNVAIRPAKVDASRLSVEGDPLMMDFDLLAAIISPAKIFRPRPNANVSPFKPSPVILAATWSCNPNPSSSPRR